MVSDRTKQLSVSLQEFYAKYRQELLFHGWHHIYFVAKKSVQFAEELGVDTEIVEAAALTHDLNYAVAANSKPAAGQELRQQFLSKAGFSNKELERIESIVLEEDLASRHAGISKEAQALSDADTLFKVLPVTPVVLAGHYITENHIDLSQLAAKVVSEQQPLLEAGIYFYTESAKQHYMPWAKFHLALWQNVKASLADEDVQEMLRLAKKSGAL